LIIGAEFRPVDRIVSSWASIACSALKTGIASLLAPYAKHALSLSGVSSIGLMHGSFNPVEPSFSGGFCVYPTLQRSYVLNKASVNPLALRENSSLILLSVPI
jgi:hypothetical protein